MEAFHRWKALGSQPTKPDLRQLDTEILAGEKVERLIDGAEAALRAGSYGELSVALDSRKRSENRRLGRLRHNSITSKRCRTS